MPITNMGCLLRYPNSDALSPVVLQVLPCFQRPGSIAPCPPGNCLSPAGGQGRMGSMADLAVLWRVSRCQRCRCYSITTCDNLRFCSGTEKVPQRTCVTKILPNFRLNFLVRFASKPLFYWVVPSNRSVNSLVLFVQFFGFGVLSWPLICAERERELPIKMLSRC